MTKPSKPDGIGPALRRLRVARQLNLSDVAPLIGTDSGSLSRIERGLRDPSMRQLSALASAYGVPLVSLVRHFSAVSRPAA